MASPYCFVESAGEVVSLSAEIDTLCTAPMWPVRLACSLPVITSHTLVCVCVFVCESVYVCTCMYVCVVQENDWSKSIHNQKAMHVHTTCSRATDTGHTGPGNVNKYHPRKHLNRENVNEYHLCKHLKMIYKCKQVSPTQASEPGKCK